MTTTLNCAIFSSAIFMRAHKEEPMLYVSIISGLAIALTSWIGSKHGTFELMIGYLIVTAFISLPWTLILLKKYMKKHSIEKLSQS
jgi:ABC-type Fe3+-siderophore transport system permease subunit